MELPYDPAIPILEIHPKKPETLIQKNICTPMFIAVLFTIPTIWKQPKCPSVDEWIKMLWYIYTMEYHSAVKRRKTYLLREHGWIPLKCIMLSEIRKSEKDQYHISLTCEIE